MKVSRLFLVSIIFFSIIGQASALPLQIENGSTIQASRTGAVVWNGAGLYTIAYNLSNVLVNVSGAFFVQYDCQNYHKNVDTYCRLYKNGIGIGTPYTINNANFVTETVTELVFNTLNTTDSISIYTNDAGSSIASLNYSYVASPAIIFPTNNSAQTSRQVNITWGFNGNVNWKVSSQSDGSSPYLQGNSSTNSSGNQTFGAGLNYIFVRGLNGGVNETNYSTVQVWTFNNSEIGIVKPILNNTITYLNESHNIDIQLYTTTLLQSLNYSWNNTVYPIYSNNLIFFSNFDNNSNIGENTTISKDISLNNLTGNIMGSLSVPAGMHYNNTIYKYGGSSFHLYDGGKISYNRTDISGNNEYTFMAWVQPDLLIAGGAGTILKLKNTTGSQQLTLSSNTAGDPRWYVRNNSGGITDIKGNISNWSIGNWSHITGIVNSTHTILCVDGLQVVSGIKPANMNTGDWNVIELGSLTSGGFDGFIDDARIYNTSMDCAQAYDFAKIDLEKKTNNIWQLQTIQSNLTLSHTYNILANFSNSTGTYFNSGTKTILYSLYPHGIDFVLPSVVNNSIINTSYYNYNASLNVYNLSNITLLWDGVSYNTLYTPNLITHLSFENKSILGDTTDIFTDSSLYNNDGVMIGEVGYTSEIYGKYGRAISGSGGGGITIPSTTALDNQSFTVAGWIFPVVLRTQGIFSKINASGYGWRVFMNDATGDIEFDAQPGEIGNIGTTPILLNNWTFITFSYNGTSITSYANGREVFSSPVGTMYNNISSDLLIFPYITDRCSCSLDEFYFYNVSLSTPDVYNLYNSSLRQTNISQYYLTYNFSNIPRYSTHNYSISLNTSIGLTNSTETRYITYRPSISSSVTSLTSTQYYTWINWTWTNPTLEYNHTDIYFNGVYQENKTVGFYNKTGLSAGQTYNISLKSYDNYGNGSAWSNSSVLMLGSLPIITGWNNSLTESNQSNLTIGINELINFSIIVDTSTNISWYSNGSIIQWNNGTIYGSLIKTLNNSETIIVNATSVYGVSNNVQWNITSLSISQTSVPIIDDFENVSEWISIYSTIYKTSAQKTQGNSSIKLNYNLSAPNYFSGINKSISQINLSNYSSMNVSIYADNSHNFMVFKYYTNSLNHYDLYYYLNNSGWNNITLFFSSAVITGIPNWSDIRYLQVGTSYNSTFDGTIYLDNLTLNLNNDPISNSERFQLAYYQWERNPITNAINGDDTWWVWDDSGHNPPLDIQSNYYPLLGAYAYNNTTTMMQHLQWINNSKIPIVVLEYWPDSYCSYCRDAGFSTWFNLSNNYGIKNAILYDAATGSPSSLFLRHYKEYIDRYNSTGSMYFDTEYGNRPLVYIYRPDSTNLTDWKNAINTLRGTKYDGIFLSNPLDYNTTNSSMYGFDGVFTYAPGVVGNYTDIILYGINNKKLSIPSISAGWVDKRTSREITGDVDRRNGSFYEEQFNDAMYKYNSSRGFIISFNEWAEGSIIEPANYGIVSDEAIPYTYRTYAPNPPTYYLDLTSKFITNYSTGGRIVYPQYYGNNISSDYLELRINTSIKPVKFNVTLNGSGFVRWYENDILVQNTTAINGQNIFYNSSTSSKKVSVNSSNINGTSATMYWILTATQVNIVNYTPSNILTTTYNITQVFNINFSVESNIQWQVDNITQEWDNGTSTGSYINSTASIGQHTVNATGCNAQGCTTQLWDWTVVSGLYIPPTPINLVSTYGTFWVNYTWSAGAENATDSYNVSILNDSVLTWYNTTLNPYKNTSTCPACWVNITIQPWNNSGTGSLNMTPINGSTFIHDPIPILVPPIIDITGIIFDEVNLTYRMSTNFSDIVPGTAKLYYNTTLSGNLSTAFINGSLVSVGIGVYGHSNNYPTNDSVNHTYTVDDDMISPTIGNIIDQYPGTNLSCTTCHRGFDYSTVTSPTNKNNLYKERLYNISALKPYNLLEFSVNTTSVVGQSPLMVFFANHSYTSGNIHTSPYACSLGSIIPTTTFNHDEGGYGVQQIPFAVNTINGTICGIKITEDSYFVLHPESTGWNIYYTNNITRPDQTRYSSNSGVGWSNFSGTLRMHVHQIGDDVWNRHACYNSSSTGNRYCSEVTHDSLGFPDVPPVGAAFTNPDGNNTFLNATNITISWTAGYSLTNGVVLGYNLSLWKQGVKLLQIANLSNTTLSYTWNTSEIGQGSDYNFRMITYSNKSLNTTTASVLFNITQSPNITAYFNDVSGWNQTTTTININNNMMFNVTVDQIVDAVSFQINGSEQQNTSSLSWTHLFNALGDYIITMQANNSNGSSNIVVTHVQVVEGGAVPPCCGGGGTDWDWSQGYVKYSNGTGIEGVLVTTSVGTATTDAVGYYTIGYNFVHGNTYNFNGTKAGYFYNSTNYAFSSGDFTWANLTMSVIPPPATITNPNITSWENGNTSNATLSLFIQKYTNFTFNATANQTIDTWSWIGATFINGTGTTDSYAYHNFTTAGIHYVTVQGTNTTNGSTQIITWTINVVGGTGLSLSGYVMNTLEFPLQNARVDLNGYHVFTSATGYYNFSNISENTYPILARQIGYRNSTQTITISNDTIVNITMKERTAGSVAAPGFSGFSVLLVLGILFYYHKKKPMQGKL